MSKDPKPKPSEVPFTDCVCPLRAKAVDEIIKRLDKKEGTDAPSKKMDALADHH